MRLSEPWLNPPEGDPVADKMLEDRAADEWAEGLVSKRVYDWVRDATVDCTDEVAALVRAAVEFAANTASVDAKLDLLRAWDGLGQSYVEDREFDAYEMGDMMEQAE
jgi:hypothetical protein